MSGQSTVSKPVLTLRLAAIGILTALLALQIGASFWSLVIKSRFIPLDTRLSIAYGSFSERNRIIRDGGMKEWGEPFWDRDGLPGFYWSVGIDRFF